MLHDDGIRAGPRQRPEALGNQRLFQAAAHRRPHQEAQAGLFARPAADRLHRAHQLMSLPGAPALRAIEAQQTAQPLAEHGAEPDPIVGRTNRRSPLRKRRACGLGQLLHDSAGPGAQRLESHGRCGRIRLRGRRRQATDRLTRDIVEVEIQVKIVCGQVVGPNLQHRPSALALGDLAQGGHHERARDAAPPVGGQHRHIADPPPGAGLVHALQRHVADDPAALEPHLSREVLVEKGHAERVAQHRAEPADDLHLAQRTPAARVQLIRKDRRDQVGHLAHVPAWIERLRTILYGVGVSNDIRGHAYTCPARSVCRLV